MRQGFGKNFKRRALAVLLALVQCFSVAGCVLDGGRADLPMAPSVAVPLVNTNKTLDSNMKKYNIAGTNAFYLLPGIESDPERMVDFVCLDYTTEGEFLYMYSAPAYIEGSQVAAYKGTKGTAPLEGSALPDRSGGILCDALIVMAYNPYSRAYRVLDAQAYSRGDDTTRLTGVEFFMADGYYMLSNAYGGKLGEEERYYVLDRAGTATVYNAKGEVVYVSALSSVLKVEIDKLIDYHYLKTSKEGGDADDISEEEREERQEAMDEVEEEKKQGNIDPSGEEVTNPEGFGISRRAVAAGINVILKSAVMDANNMTYASVMLYDRPSPWDPDAKICEEVISCYSVKLDSEYVKYTSYNRNWPKQKAEWLKLDNQTVSVHVGDENSLSGALNNIQKAGLGRGITMNDLIGNDIKKLQQILGMDMIKTGNSNNWSNVSFVKQFLGIEMQHVPDHYSPFMLGKESGFPSFIAGWSDISNDISKIDKMLDYQDTGYELTEQEQILKNWFAEDMQRFNENYERLKWVWGDESGDKSLSGLWKIMGDWRMLYYMTDKERVKAEKGRRSGLFDNIGAMQIQLSKISRTSSLTSDVNDAFRSLWNGTTGRIWNTQFKEKKFWFIKLGYKKVGTTSITLTNGFSNNWKRSIYTGSYYYFRNFLYYLPPGDYSNFEKPATGTGYDNLADGRLYVQMASLESMGLTPEPGQWDSSSQRNASPFKTGNVETLFAYHESQFKGRMEETSAVICEVPADEDPLAAKGYQSSTMEVESWNEELRRTIHIDFSEKRSTRLWYCVTLPYITDWDGQDTGTVREGTHYMSDVDSHWRDALTVYLRDRLNNGDRRLYDDVTNGMKTRHVSHTQLLAKALDEALAPRKSSYYDTYLGKWVDYEYTTYFTDYYHDICEAMLKVSKNVKNVESARITAEKALAKYYSKRSYDYYCDYVEAYNNFVVLANTCYNPINQLSAPAKMGYREFRNACNKYGVTGFVTMVAPAGADNNYVTRSKPWYDPVKKQDVQATYSFYFNEDAWWDDANSKSWEQFVDNDLVPSGRYSSDEISAIRDIYKGLLHVTEVIPAGKIPTAYRMKLPPGTTASFATVAEQMGSATTAPEEGAILFHDTATIDQSGDHHFTANIDYVYPQARTGSTIWDLINLLLGLTNSSNAAKGLSDSGIPGAAIDAGYIGYDDGAGDRSQIIVLATDEGVKFYNGVKVNTTNGRDWFVYSSTRSTYITNKDLLTSTGYTPSVQEQTATAMEKLKKEESPDANDGSGLDANGQFVDRGSTAGSASTGSSASSGTGSTANAGNSSTQGDVKDQKAGENLMTKEHVQEVLNSARVGTLKAVTSFTMSGKNEILISAYDTGLSLFNSETGAVVPLANGSYYQSFHVKSTKNKGAETDAVLEEQKDTKEQSYKVLGFNTMDYEYGNLDLARCKVYDLDLAGGKAAAYELAVKQELQQRAVDYIRMPLRTRVNEENKLESIVMTDEEKAAYEEYTKLFAGDEATWTSALDKLAVSIGLLKASDELQTYALNLRKRVADQKAAMNAIYAMLGCGRLTTQQVADNKPYWDNLALRLSTVVERDAMESIMIEIRMREDVAGYLDEETQARYAEYRKVFDMSTEQGEVKLSSTQTLIDEAENLGQNPTTNANVLMQGIQENGDAHDYLTDALGSPTDNEMNKRGEYFNAVLTDIRALVVKLYENQRLEDETDDALYQRIAEKWLSELNPDNFRELDDEVLMDFLKVLNMVDDRIPEGETTLLQAREERIRKAIPDVSSLVDIEALIISEMLQMTKYAGYVNDFTAWQERDFDKPAQRAAMLRQMECYQTIITMFKENKSVKEYLFQLGLSWEDYLRMIIRQIGKGVVYTDDGKVEGAVSDVDEAVDYYNTYGTLNDYSVTADIGEGDAGTGFMGGNGSSSSAPTIGNTVRGPLIKR
ncbi:MAG: hypothetical protein K6G16_11340 [Lachnospiraceae bacterium]|nr:hypothetical protein [Lachnospiraceae bacterium]